MIKYVAGLEFLIVIQKATRGNKTQTQKIVDFNITLPENLIC